MTGRPRRPTPIRITPPPTATVAEFVATLGAVIGAILALLLFDSALAAVDVRGRQAYARREFATGERLIAQKRLAEGVEHLRSAASLDATHISYGTALAEATLAQGKPRQAQLLLKPLLEQSANDGAANLAMARALKSEGRGDEAKSYYHRAIYGSWPVGSDSLRAGARLELIDFLAATGARQELLAELLPIQDDSAADVATRRKIARQFIAAGSAARAVPIFRNLLQRNAKDTGSYIGMAESGLWLGNFASARTNLLAAEKLAPEDTGVKRWLTLTDSVIALDPTQRGLSLGEQYRRSRNLIERTLASVRSCLGTEAPQVAIALDSASHLLVARPEAEQGQSIEQSLALAQHLWGLKRSHCARAREESALSLVQNRIAQ